jgi:hypothetical protein
MKPDAASICLHEHFVEARRTNKLTNMFFTSIPSTSQSLAGDFPSNREQHNDCRRPQKLSQTSMSSPLFRDPEAGAGAADPLVPQPASEFPPAEPSFGGLKANPMARTRREKVKFFDSADWASGRPPSDSETAKLDRLSELTQAPESIAPVAEGELGSPSTGE